MKKLFTLVLALLLALSLSACGGGGEDAGAQAVVRCGLSSAWDSLMPYNSPSGSNYSRIIYDKIYDRLAYVHADGTLEPRGAESWESADGGYAVLFHLDQGAAFHDGTPVTAEHWADTIALLTDPDCPTLGRAAFSVLAGTDDNGAAVEGEALGAPGFDQLVIRVIDKSNLLTSLIAGDLDYYAFGGNVSVEDAQVAEEAGLTVAEGTVPNYFYELMLNNETIPSAAIRRAIDLALDKEALCLQSAQGLGEPAASDLTPGTGYDSGLTWSRDVEGAKALLAQGGYDGRTYTLACTSNRSGLAALMQQELAEAGVAVVIETVDSATLFAGMADGKYDMAIASHTPGALPLWFTASRFAEGNNIFHVADLTPYTDYISAIQGEADQTRRQALVTEFQAFLAQERPFIPLWFSRTLHVQSPTVDGIDYPSSTFSNENVWDWEYRG